MSGHARLAITPRFGSWLPTGFVSTAAAAPPAPAPATSAAVLAAAVAVLVVFAAGLVVARNGARGVVLVVVAFQLQRLVFVLVLIGLVVEVVFARRRVGLDGGGEGGVVGAGLHGRPLDHVVGVGHGVFDQHGDEQSERLEQPRQVRALLVQDVEADCARHAQGGFAAPLQRLDLEGSQGGQRRGFNRPHASGAGAVFADVGGALEHAGAAALAADLHQAEGGDLARLRPGAVVIEAILQLLLDLAAVLRLFHVDEVDDDQAGEVAQS